MWRTYDELIGMVKKLFSSKSKPHKKEGNLEF